MQTENSVVLQDCQNYQDIKRNLQKVEHLEINNRIKVLTFKNEDLKNKLDQSLKEKQCLNEKVEVLLQQIKSITRINDKLEHQFYDFEQKMKNNQSHFQSEYQNQIEILQSKHQEFDELNIKTEILLQHYNQLLQNEENLLYEIEQYENRAVSSGQQLAEIKNEKQHNEIKVNKVLNENQKLILIIEKCEKQIKQLDSRIEMDQKQYNQNIARMKSEYENTIQDLEQRNIMLKDNEDSLNWQVQCLENKLDQLERQKEDDIKDLCQLNKDKLEQFEVNKTKEINKLKQYSDEQQRKHQQLIELHQQLNQQHQQLIEQNQQINQTHNQLSNQYYHVIKKLEEKNEKNEKNEIITQTDLFQNDQQIQTDINLQIYEKQTNQLTHLKQQDQINKKLLNSEKQKYQQILAEFNQFKETYSQMALSKSIIENESVCLKEESNKIKEKSQYLNQVCTENFDQLQFLQQNLREREIRIQEQEHRFQQRETQYKQDIKLLNEKLLDLVSQSNFDQVQTCHCQQKQQTHSEQLMSQIVQENADLKQQIQSIKNEKFCERYGSSQKKPKVIDSLEKVKLHRERSSILDSTLVSRNNLNKFKIEPLKIERKTSLIAQKQKKKFQLERYEKH